MIYFIFISLGQAHKREKDKFLVEHVDLSSHIISTTFIVANIFIVGGMVHKVDAVEGHTPEYPYSHSITT